MDSQSSFNYKKKFKGKNYRVKNKRPKIAPEGKVYGFKKYSIKQTGPISKTRARIRSAGREAYHLKKTYKEDYRFYRLYKDIYRGIDSTSYLSPYFLNKYYHTENNIGKAFDYIYKCYSDIESIISDLERDDIRDIVIYKILSLSKFDLDLDFIFSNHEDILGEVLFNLYKRSSKEFIHTNLSAFYTYVVNVLPFLYINHYNLIYNKAKKYYTTLEDAGLDLDNIVSEQIVDYAPLEFLYWLRTGNVT